MIAFLDHEDHPVIPAIDKKDAARENEVEVVGVTGVPQQLAGLGMQHLTGRPQQVEGVRLNTGQAGPSPPPRRRDEK